MKKLSIVGGESHRGGPVVFSWQPGGNYLATTGGNGVVHVFDSLGQNIDDIIIPGITSPGVILNLEWNYSGEVLAILSKGSVPIYMWELSTKTTNRLDTKIPHLSFMAWSRQGSKLVVGSEHGNCLIYDLQTQKKSPVLGKHPQRITCGAWGKGNLLALGSEDGTITLSNEVGDTLDQTGVKCSPTELHFSGQCGKDKDIYLSLKAGGRSIFLCAVKDLNSKIELTFEREYGDIAYHLWLDNSLIAVAFRKGHVVIVSTNQNEIGQEQFSRRFDKEGCITASYSPVRNCLAIASERGVKIIDLHNYKEIKNGSMTFGSQNSRTIALAWSPDGKILTIATEDGNLYNFIDHPQTTTVFHASYGTRLAYLSKLCEVNVVDGAAHTNSLVPPRSIVIPILIEPSFVALGANHVAVGTHNHVMYYRIKPNDRCCAREKRYLGNVDKIRLNDNYAAVLFEGKVVLHTIEVEEKLTTSNTKKESSAVAAHAATTTPSQQITFSPESSNGTITAISLTEHVFVYGTMAGEINLFHIQDWCLLNHVNTHRFNPIRSLCPNYLGIRQLMIDGAGMGYIYSPATGAVVTVPEFPVNAVVTFWDQQDRHVFFVTDAEGYLHTYVYTSLSVQGESVTKLGKAEVAQGGVISIVSKATLMPTEHKPILSIGGTITCQVNDGMLATFLAAPYADIQQSMKSNAPASTRCACVLQNLALLRFQHAWRSAVVLDERVLYVALGNRALEAMDTQTALNVYRQLGDAGMVMSLEMIEDIEDKNLLAGHISQLFGNFAKAQKLFLESSTPKAALSMRRNLLQWDQALNLAKNLDPQSYAEISAELGHQLENCGNYDEALSAYEGSLKGKYCLSDGNNTTERNDDELRYLLAPAIGLSEEQTFSCMAGVARCSLWLGDMHRGIRIAQKSGSEQLLKECAKILESLKQNLEAAVLWEMVNQPERAAMIYIRTKNIDKAASVLHSVKRPKLLLEYAKVCESMKRWQEAAKAYERAGDLDSVVRICLKKLDEPHRACHIVRETLSITRALMVTAYYEERQKWREAIEFLIMAKCSDKALELAMRENKIGTFTELVGESISPKCALKVAQYYETLQVDIPKAGKFYSLCGQYHRALSMFLQCGGDKNVLDSAVDVVGKARNDKLTLILTDFLSGETDGVPKDPKYMYKLHMALENFTDAAKATIAIAAEQQKLGHYQVAHRTLYDAIHLLEVHHVDVPHSMRQKFVLIHSYMLAKSLVHRDDHEGAARMLIRVAKGITEFPGHVVPILTSTVIECQRAGLKKSAFEIDKKLKRNIEAIVRHPVLNQVPELLTQCPISGELIPATQLECPTSRDAVLPMCIITGRHMEQGDWCICPASGMPALMSHYQEYLSWESMNTELMTKTTKDVNKPSQGHEGGASGHDPILGKLVCSSELRRCSSSEISEMLNSYNRKDDYEKNSDSIEPSGGPTEPPSIAFEE